MCSEEQILSLLPPILAQRCEIPVDDDELIYEFKYDGVRILADIGGESVSLYTRNANDLAPLFPEFTSLSDRFEGASAVLDGELIVLKDDGTHSFYQLMRRVRSSPSSAEHFSRTIPATVVFFDCLSVDDEDLRQKPLVRRRQLLKDLMRWGGRVQFSPCVEGSYGSSLFTEADVSGLEGVVAKQHDSKYIHGRSSAWSKIKAMAKGRMVVGGITHGRDEILVGVTRDGCEDLCYLGTVHLPQQKKVREYMGTNLESLKSECAPFSNIDKKTVDTWMKPVLTCEVAYTQITAGGSLRHPEFLRFIETSVDLCRWETLPKNCARGEFTDSGTETELRSSPENLTDRLPLITAADGSTYLDIDGRRVGVSNLNKMLWDDPPLSKGQILAYYYLVRKGLLRYIKNKPLVLTRYPDGPSGESFYQKRAPAHRPDWIETVRIPSSDGHIDYLVCNDAATLMWLINLAAFELHPFPVRPNKTGMNADFLVVDLDPAPPAGSPEAQHAALLVEQLLGGIGVRCWVKSSGGRGYHIILPLHPKYTGDHTAELVEIMGQILIQDRPDLFTLQRSKTDRSGKVYVDYLQNKWGRTVVAPYCLRGSEEASVSLPLSWEKLFIPPTATSRDQHTALQSAIAQYIRYGDIWKEMLTHRWELTEILRRLRKTYR